MSEISEKQQLIDEIQFLKKILKHIEDQLNSSSQVIRLVPISDFLKELSKSTQKQDMVDSNLEPTIEQDSVSSTNRETEDIKSYEILSIEGIINLIHIGNRKPLEQFKLKAKIVAAATREGSQYGKTRPQEIIISDEKNQQFKLQNWHKSKDQELKDLKDKWVIFDSVYLKENDSRFPDNQVMGFTIKGEYIQFSIHSSKKFKIVPKDGTKEREEMRNDH